MARSTPNFSGDEIPFRESLSPARLARLGWLVSIAFFMQALDGTILNTAIPAMARNLNESALQMESVVIAYALTLAIGIPVSGWLADHFGTRRVFVGAILLFTFGSLLCACAPNLSLLVAARVVQAAGGSMMVPVGRLAVLRAYPRERLIGAMNKIIIPALVGPVIGPVLGGWLVTVATWRWIFLINLPVGALGMWLAKRHMPDYRTFGHGSFDWVGYLLFASGIVLISIALDSFGEATGGFLTLAPMILAGCVLLGGYGLHARRASRPLYEPAIFRNRAFRIGIMGNLGTRLGAGGLPFLFPLFLQVGFGYGAAHAGLMLSSVAIAMLASKPFTEMIVKRLGFRRVLIINTCLVGTQISCFGLLGAGTPAWLVVGMLFIQGLCNSIQFTAMNTLTLADLPDLHASSGNSLLSTTQQLSMSCGVAVVSALLGLLMPSGAASQHHLVIVGFQRTFLLVGAMTIASSLIFARLEATDGRRAIAYDPLPAGAE